MSILPSSFSFDYLDFPSSNSINTSSHIPTNFQSTSNTSSHATPLSGTSNTINQISNNTVPREMYGMRLTSQLGGATANAYASGSGGTYQNEVDRLKMQLNLKSQIINNLQKRVVSQEQLGDKAPTTNGSFYALFKSVSSQLQHKNEECKKLPSYLESVLVSLAMKEEDSSHEELVHRIVNKINGLSKENEKLMNAISFSNKLNLLIELGVLRNEILVLREKLSQYEK